MHKNNNVCCTLGHLGGIYISRVCVFFLMIVCDANRNLDD